MCRVAPLATGNPDVAFYWLLVGVLVVWRVTHLLQAERGPWSLLERLRARAGTGGFGELLHCFYCLSLWIAAPVALVVTDRWTERALLWPALSAGAILLERVTQSSADAPPAMFTEDASPSPAERIADPHARDA